MIIHGPLASVIGYDLSGSALTLFNEIKSLQAAPPPPPRNSPRTRQSPSTTGTSIFRSWSVSSKGSLAADNRRRRSLPCGGRGRLFAKKSGGSIAKPQASCQSGLAGLPGLPSNGILGAVFGPDSGCGPQSDSAPKLRCPPPTHGGVGGIASRHEGNRGEPGVGLDGVFPDTALGVESR